MKFVIFRDTSQDGLENFFGCVKSCNQSNKPTAREYRIGYGTMTINNITGTNSLRSNCEQDTSTSILTNIHEFILDCNDEASKGMMEIDEFIAFDPNCELESDQLHVGIDDMIVFDPEPDDEDMDLIESVVIPDNGNVDELILFDPQFDDETLNYFENEAILRDSTVICQKLMKFNHCVECKDVLQTTETSIVRNCMNVLSGLNITIPHFCSEKSLKTKLLAKIESIETGVMGCSDHDLEMIQKMKELSADRAITSFCYDINSFLSGKKEALPLNYNHIQKLAFSQYDSKRKKKKIGKYSDIFNA